MTELNGWRVKPLEWKDRSAAHRVMLDGNSGLGFYAITQRYFPESFFSIEPPQGKPFTAPTLEAAKAAAQADYEARIMAALEPMEPTDD